MKKKILAPASKNDIQAYEQLSCKMQEEGWTITKIGTIFVTLEKCGGSSECKQSVPVEELLWDKTDGRKAPGLRTEMFNNVVQLIIWLVVFFNFISNMDFSEWFMTIAAVGILEILMIADTVMLAKRMRRADAAANLISDFRVGWYRTVRIIMPLFCLSVLILNGAFLLGEMLNPESPGELIWYAIFVIAIGFCVIHITMRLIQICAMYRLDDKAKAYVREKKWVIGGFTAVVLVLTAGGTASWIDSGFTKAPYLVACGLAPAVNLLERLFVLMSEQVEKGE